MTQLLITHSDTEPFRAFDTVRDVVGRLRDVETATQIDISLRGFTPSQNKAIFALLSTSLAFAHSEALTGECHKESDPGEENILFTMPGIGRLISEPTSGSRGVVLHLKRNLKTPFDTNGMLRQLALLHKTIQDTRASKPDDNSYHARPCDSVHTADVLYSILKPLAEAHGFRGDRDVFIKGDISVTTTGETQAGKVVAIRTKALDEILSHENQRTQDPITVSKKPGDPLQVYATIRNILKQSKDRGSAQAMTDIKLEGYDYDEAQAVFALLGASMSFALSAQMQGSIDHNFNPATAKSYIVLPGVGSMTAKHDRNTKTTNISIPLMILPAYHTEHALNENERMLAGMQNVLLQINEGHYNAIAFEDNNGMETALMAMKKLAVAHGFTAEPDVLRVNRIVTTAGIKPGIAARDEVLSEIIRKEGLRTEFIQPTMTTVRKDKGFRAYATAKEVLAKYDSKSENDYTFQLQGFNQAEAKAVIVQLAHAFTYAANDKLQGEITISEAKTDGVLDYVMPGIGTVVTKHDPQTARTIVTIPRPKDGPLPIQRMNQIIRRNEKILTNPHRVACTVEGHHYQAILCESEKAVNQIIHALLPIIEAHGHGREYDLATHPEIPVEGGPKPAVLISDNVYNDLIAKEGLGQSKGQRYD